MSEVQGAGRLAADYVPSDCALGFTGAYFVSMIDALDFTETKPKKPRRTPGRRAYDVPQWVRIAKGVVAVLGAVVSGLYAFDWGEKSSEPLRQNRELVGRIESSQRALENEKKLKLMGEQIEQLQKQARGQ